MGVFQVTCDLFNSSMNLFRPIQWLQELFEVCSLSNANNIQAVKTLLYSYHQAITRVEVVPPKRIRITPKCLPVNSSDDNEDQDSVTEEDTKIERSTPKARSDLAWTLVFKNAIYAHVQTNHYWT
jgi:hypothetical protein